MLLKCIWILMPSWLDEVLIKYHMVQIDRPRIVPVIMLSTLWRHTTDAWGKQDIQKCGTAHLHQRDESQESFFFLSFFFIIRVLENKLFNLSQLYFLFFFWLSLFSSAYQQFNTVDLLSVYSGKQWMKAVAISSCGQLRVLHNNFFFL